MRADMKRRKNGSRKRKFVVARLGDRLEFHESWHSNYRAPSSMSEWKSYVICSCDWATLAFVSTRYRGFGPGFGVWTRGRGTIRKSDSIAVTLSKKLYSSLEWYFIIYYTDTFTLFLFVGGVRSGCASSMPTLPLPSLSEGSREQWVRLGNTNTNTKNTHPLTG